MQIRRVDASYLTNVPSTPPPFLDGPSPASVIIAEIETDDSIIGYGATGGPIPWSIAEFINRQAAPAPNIGGRRWLMPGWLMLCRPANGVMRPAEIARQPRFSKAPTRRG